MRAAACALIASGLLGRSNPANAHAVDAVPTLATAWSLSPVYLALPVLMLVLHLVGLGRLWHRAGIGRGVSLPEAAAFGAGVIVMFFALVWPLDAYGEWSLAAHMAQHMLLLALAPPLLLAGRPMAMLTHALPRTWLRPLHDASAGSHARLITWLAAATLAHGAVMSAWHLPAATTLALQHEGIHVAMHVSFLIAGLWFWSALWRCMREPDVGLWAALVALVSSMMLMGLIGALLTFSRRALYPIYVERTAQIGLDPLVDQQLAGLIMWVPACLPYLAGGIWLAARSVQRSRSQEAHQDPAGPATMRHPIGE